MIVEDLSGYQILNFLNSVSLQILINKFFKGEFKLESTEEQMIINLINKIIKIMNKFNPAISRSIFLTI